MVTGQQLLINSETRPLMSAKMKISRVSWIVSTEIDSKDKGSSPLGTSPWCCTTWQRLLLNQLKRPLWSIWLSGRSFSLALGSGKCRSEIHAWQNKNIRDQSDSSKASLYPSPSCLSKNKLAKEGPDSEAPVVIPALARTLDRSLKYDRSLCPVRALCCYLDRTSDIRQNKELVFVSFKKGFDKDISPATISSWIKQTVILWALWSGGPHLTSGQSPWCQGLCCF